MSASEQSRTRHAKGKAMGGEEKTRRAERNSRLLVLKKKTRKYRKSMFQLLIENSTPYIKEKSNAISPILFIAYYIQIHSSLEAAAHFTHTTTLKWKS